MQTRSFLAVEKDNIVHSRSFLLIREQVWCQHRTKRTKSFYYSIPKYVFFQTFVRGIIFACKL